MKSASDISWWTRILLQTFSTLRLTFRDRTFSRTAGDFPGEEIAAFDLGLALPPLTLH
ncbi:MAG: hypothetical protein ACLFN4_04935 [Candidatus Acetothermia bacterium]